MKRLVLLSMIFVMVFACSAQAYTTRASSDFVSTLDQIEGDVDPVTLGDWSATSYGSPFTAVNGDGTLTMVTSSDNYETIEHNASNDDFDSAVGWTWETRFRIDSANVANRGVWEIFIRDNDSGLAATRIHFLSTGLDRDTSGNGVDAEVAADLTDGFHVVRGVVEGGTNSTTVWLDGVMVIDALASSTFNDSEFSKIGRWGGQTSGGTATIDYIRFDTTGAYAPPVGSGTVIVSGEPVVDEDGTTSDSFDISLGYNPNDIVTITLNADNNQITLDKEVIVFDSDSWDIPETVTVTAVADGVKEEPTHSTDITFSLSSGSSLYDGLAVTPLAVEITDVISCGPWGYLAADFDKNCQVNIADVAEFASQWLGCTHTNKPGCSNASAIELKIMTFNILASGGSVSEVGSSSPLYYQPRYQDIANAIIESGADIVGVTENNTAAPASDPILLALQADDGNWQKLGKVYAKFPIEQDPDNPTNSSRDSYAYRVEIAEDKWVYIHVAHWWPSGGYGPMAVQSDMIDGTVPADLGQYEQDILAEISTPGSYNHTLGRLQVHIDAGRPVFLMGDFNEASHLDWTSDYAANGADRWANNPSGTPLRFDIEWQGSKTLTDAGMIDAYRSIWPDPVAKPGNTWTPPYANNTPGRRPYDADAPDGPNQVLDRIDWVMFAGDGVTVTDASVVGENPNNPEHAGKSEIVPEIQYSGSWPSDHRAVIATFLIE